MNQPRLMLVLVILLAAASLGTTALVALTVARHRAVQRDSGPAITTSAGAAGMAPSPLFDQPLPLPAFTLTERSGETLALDDLGSKVWVADFFFTHCPGFCPQLTRIMSNLQRRLAVNPRWSDVRLVSISVDPEHDTPQRLRDYADIYEADPQQWLFLTGERAAIEALVIGGFKQTMMADPDPASASPILHSSKLALVDRRGRIRGYYEAFSPPEVEALERDIERLLDEPAQAPPPQAR